MNVYVLARILSTKELRVASFYHIGLYSAVQILSVVFGAPQVVAAFVLPPPIESHQNNSGHQVLSDYKNYRYNWTPPSDIIRSDYNVNGTDYIDDFGSFHYTGYGFDRDNFTNNFNWTSPFTFWESSFSLYDKTPSSYDINGSYYNDYFGWYYYENYDHIDLEYFINSFNVSHSSDFGDPQFPNSTSFLGKAISTIKVVPVHYLIEAENLFLYRIDFNFSCTTMLAIAIERYIYICRATDAQTLLSKKRHKRLCFLTTLMTLVLSTLAVVTDVIFEQNNAKWFHTCVDLIQNVYWVISIFTCLVLYVKIILQLKHLRRNAEQNSKLNKAFIASWVAWFLFWTPEILTRVAFAFFTKFSVLFLISNFSLYSVIEPFVITLRLLSNVITPSLFIFISPPFQTPILDAIKKVTRG